MTTANLLRRLQKLEATTSSKFITFRMPDGTFKKLLHKDYCSVICDAIYGVVSPQTEIVRNAVSCNETGRLLELMQMCIE